MQLYFLLNTVSLEVVTMLNLLEYILCIKVRRSSAHCKALLLYYRTKDFIWSLYIKLFHKWKSKEIVYFGTHVFYQVTS